MESEKEPYGFVYVTTNLVNGKRYVGQKVFNHTWKSYIGSGSLLTKAVKKYGKQNFKRVILSIAYSPDELNDQEVQTIAFFDAANSDDYYNIEIGGMKYPLSEHTKMMISKNHADMRGEKSPCYGKPLSPETKAKLSASLRGRKVHNKGVPMSEEQKEKLKEAWKHRSVRVCNHREIICVETGETFYSIQEAARELGLVAASIQAVLKGKRNSLFKKHFIYKEEDHE